MAWVLFLGSVGSVVQAQVYKWVDERGVTHYGERTPQGRKGQEVQNKLANPAPGPGAGKAPSWQEQEQDFQGRRQQAEQAQQAEARKQAQEANQRQACVQARDELLRMKSASRLYKLNEKGERIIESDQEREAAIARQEQ